jgi:hypothetical protein
MARITEAELADIIVEILQERPNDRRDAVEQLRRQA